MKKILYVSVLLFMSAAASCANASKCGIRLSGIEREKTCEIADGYSSLEVSDAVDVLYSSSAEKVTVKADSSVIRYVKVEENGGCLKIYVSGRWTDRFAGRNIGKISVVVPASGAIGTIRLRGASDFGSDAVIVADDLAVQVSGASGFNADIEAKGHVSMSASGASDITSAVSADVLEVDASGASDVSVSGRVSSYKVTASGASSVSSGKAFIETESLECNISGASDAYVKCNSTADGQVSGASSVVVYGEGKVDISSSGASSVRRR